MTFVAWLLATWGHDSALATIPQRTLGWFCQLLDVSSYRIRYKKARLTCRAFLMLYAAPALRYLLNQSSVRCHASFAAASS